MELDLVYLLAILGFVLWPVLGALALARWEEGRRSVYYQVCRGAFRRACLCSLALAVLAIALPLAYGNWLAYLVCVVGFGPVLGALPGAAIARNNFDQRRWDEVASGKRYEMLRRDEAPPQPFQFGLGSLFILMTVVAVLCGLAASAPVVAMVCCGIIYAFGPCVILAASLLWPRIPRRNRKTLGLILSVVVATPMTVCWCYQGGVGAAVGLLVGTSCLWAVQSAVLAVGYYSFRRVTPLLKAPPSYPVACVCGRQVMVLASLAGLETACPECGAMLQVPPLAELEAGRAEEK